MSPSPSRLISVLARHRATILIAFTVALATSGTAAAAAYLVLGTINSASTTTTLKSGVDGAVLQLTSSNTTGGVNARGLGINVPAGRAPIKVNASAGKATNLDADKLDGLDESAFARGTDVTVLSNRLVLNSDSAATLLVVPSLGELRGTCRPDQSGTYIAWSNTTTTSIDQWSNWNRPDNRLVADIADPGAGYVAAQWLEGGPQTGDTLLLGQGNSPGPRRTASVTLGVYRTAAGAPCGFQATATIWSTP